VSNVMSTVSMTTMFNRILNKVFNIPQVYNPSGD
jgi:hypothetical protein